MKKLTVENKAKLLYSGELFLFFIIFEVIGLLEFFEVITLLKKHPNWIYYLSVIGIIFGIYSLITYVFVKKKREQKSLLDLLLTLPSLILLAVFDIYYLINKANFIDLRYIVSILFVYNGLSYLIQSVVHWFKPIPGLIDDKTENLIIRRFRLSDVDFYVTNSNNVDVINTIKEEINKKAHSEDFYAIETKIGNKLIGEISIIENESDANFDFYFFDEVKNHEYIVESASFLIKEAFKNKLKKLNAKIANENKNKIFEELGFKLDTGKCIYFIEQNSK